jgi:hypothetical protein
MPIVLESYAFKPGTTSAKERYEEVGGRNERRITIEGLISKSTTTAIETELDTILKLASSEDATAVLSIRPGRRLLVRRNKFVRDMSHERLAGAFELELVAPNPNEESEMETEVEWEISASGAALPLTSAGTANSELVIAVQAIGDLVNPAFSDGIRTLEFEGVVPAGSWLVINGHAQMVSRDAELVTPYTRGLFPLLTPPSALLTYTDHASSSHNAVATITYRDRWW